MSTTQTGAPAEISGKTGNPEKISGRVPNPNRTLIPLGKPKSGRVWKDRSKQRRKERDEKKAEIVQVIRNTAKLKRMKKKQLRNIVKRDTLSALQEVPPTTKKPPQEKN